MLRIVAIDETGCPNLVETSDEEAINALSLIYSINIMLEQKSHGVRRNSVSFARLIQPC